MTEGITNDPLASARCESKPKRKQRTDIYSIGLVIPIDLYRRLKGIADEEGRSISNMTRRMIEDYLDRCGGDKK